MIKLANQTKSKKISIVGYTEFKDTYKNNSAYKFLNNFTKNEDYKVALIHTEKRKNEGGHNKEIITMNIKTFKKLCLKN